MAQLQATLVNAKLTTERARSLLGGPAGQQSTFDAATAAQQSLEWLLPKQVLDVKGDWAVKRPEVRPGGWAFQYNNAFYPDLDDTAVVVMAMDRSRRGTQSHEYDAAIASGREWIEGMQSRDGGWAAFDVDNLEYYLNNIPFSDHGALLDPPTEDVTAPCLSMLAQLGDLPERNEAADRAVDYLRATQLADGSWFGRWGMNYIYGTWSVLCALNAAGLRTVLVTNQRWLSEKTADPANFAATQRRLD